MWPHTLSVCPEVMDWAAGGQSVCPMLPVPTCRYFQLGERRRKIRVGGVPRLPLMLPTSPPPPCTGFRSRWHWGRSAAGHGPGAGGALGCVLAGHGSGAGGALGGVSRLATVPELAECVGVGHGSGAVPLISGNSPRVPLSPRYSPPRASHACRCCSFTLHRAKTISLGMPVRVWRPALGGMPAMHACVCV